MNLLRKTLLIGFLFIPIFSLNAFYLPGITMSPKGSFYSGYSSDYGGYMGTTFLFSNFLPKTDLTLDVLSTLPNKKSVRQLNMAILGVASKFRLLNGSIEVNLFYQAPFSFSSFSGRNSYWQKRF